MSGGLAVKTKKRGVVRAGDRAQRGRLHGPRFLLVLVLTAWGPQAPAFNKTKNGRMARAQRSHSPAPKPVKRAPAGA
jgi:hypothetical protein